MFPAVRCYGLHIREGDYVYCAICLVLYTYRWSAVTQAYFPNSMQHCYSTVASSYNPADHKRILITRVDDEYRKWRGQSLGRIS